MVQIVDSSTSGQTFCGIIILLTGDALNSDNQMLHLKRYVNNSPISDTETLPGAHQFLANRGDSITLKMSHKVYSEISRVANGTGMDIY